MIEIIEGEVELEPVEIFVPEKVFRPARRIGTTRIQTAGGGGITIRDCHFGGNYIQYAYYNYYTNVTSGTEYSGTEYATYEPSIDESKNRPGSDLRGQASSRPPAPRAPDKGFLRRGLRRVQRRGETNA